LPRFDFRLKTLLAVRGATRAERQVELREAFDAQGRLQERRDAIERELASAPATAPPARGPIAVAGLQLADQYTANLVAQRAHLRALEQRLAEEIARRREAVVAADREVRVLERLRERQHDAFLQDQARAERKHFDEVAARGAATSASL
jgi:flagellar export protein FliJ